MYSLTHHCLRNGFPPIPDHRILPQVSYEQMLRYIRVFNEVFNEA